MGWVVLFCAGSRMTMVPLWLFTLSTLDFPATIGWITRAHIMANTAEWQIFHLSCCWAFFYNFSYCQFYKTPYSVWPLVKLYCVIEENVSCYNFFILVRLMIWTVQTNLAVHVHSAALRLHRTCNEDNLYLSGNSWCFPPCDYVYSNFLYFSCKFATFSSYHNYVYLPYLNIAWNANRSCAFVYSHEAWCNRIMYIFPMPL